MTFSTMSPEEVIAALRAGRTLIAASGHEVTEVRQGAEWVEIHGPIGLVATVRVSALERIPFHLRVV